MSLAHGQTFKRHFTNIGVDSVVRFDSLAAAPALTQAGKTIIYKGGSTYSFVGAGYVGGVFRNLDSVSVNTTGDGWWGDGSDGDATITSNTSLTRDMFYNNLTLTAGDTLRPKAYRIFVKGTATINGVLGSVGGNGANGDSGRTWLCNTSRAWGGTGGLAGVSDTDAYVGANGTAPVAGRGQDGTQGSDIDSSDCATGVNGFAGGTACNESTAAVGASQYDATQVVGSLGTNGSIGGHGGGGGNPFTCGSGDNKDGCPGRAASYRVAMDATQQAPPGGGSSQTWIPGFAHSIIDIALARTFPRQASSQTSTIAAVMQFRYHALSTGGGLGGGGGSRTVGGDISRGGGGGGGGGAGGNAGPVFLFAKSITGTGKIVSIGGNGGTGGKGGDGWVSGGTACGGAGGGGGGGAGGQGHIIYIIYRDLSGVTVQALGGTGGSGGAAGTSKGQAAVATAGDAGTNGVDGLVVYYTL